MTRPNGRIVFYDGYTQLTGDGRVLPSVSSSSDVLDLNNIGIKNAAPTGEYLIRFKSATSFEVLHPDNTIISGNTLTPFDSDFISILPSYWNGVAEDGDEITFQVRSTIEGNPITLIMYLIERAFLRNWGTRPGFGEVGTDSVNLPVVWTKLWELEEQFKNWPCRISETNKDNAVWADTAVGNRPLNCMKVARQIADAIGVSITRNLFGEIDATGPNWNPETIPVLTDTGSNSPFLIDFKIDPSQRFNYIRFKYGLDSETGNYIAEIVEDLRTDPESEINEKIIPMPYFKAGLDDAAAHTAKGIIMNRLFYRQVQATAKVTRNFALPAMPGDKAYIVSSIQPKMQGAFECNSVAKSIDEPGTLKLNQLGKGVTPKTYCAFTLCEDVLC